MVYVLSINGDVVGVFTDVKELALAIWQHRKELILASFIYSAKDVYEYMQDTPLDGNHIIACGVIGDFMPNIDYTTYRLPSLTEEMERDL